MPPLKAHELAAKLCSREISAMEALDESLRRIQSCDTQVKAFLTVAEDQARNLATIAQSMLDKGEGRALTGVPIALKDNISTDGIRTTCASKILENYIPPYDATITAKLKAEGMVLIGKTNLDEFAMGTSTENGAFGPSYNPWDLQRSPGGSSGGSAAAVCAGMVPLSLGSDTGGSIRFPASLCGICGFKPTYGRASRYGLIAYGSSLDQIGPFATCIEDIALVSQVITGYDDHESTSLQHPPIQTADLKNGSLKGLRMAVPKQFLNAQDQSGLMEVFEDSVEKLRKEGVEVDEVSIPSIDLGVTTYYIIAPAEASSNLGRFDGVRYGPRVEEGGHIDVVAKTRGQLFGHEVKTRIMIGTYVLSAGYFDAYYTRAQQIRALMSQDFEKLYQEFDLVMGPTSPVVAFKIGELSGDPMALKVLDTCTIPANMGGFPAISIPCGFTQGLPVGLQLMGPVLGDERLLQVAYCVEQVFSDAIRLPPLVD